MAKEIPGFYFDAEKNRYFPRNRTVPGSRPGPDPVPPPPDPNEDATSSPECRSIRRGLLYARELCGNVILSRRGKLSFQTEFRRKLAKEPVIVKCKETAKIGNVALQQIVADVNMPDGLREIDILLSAGVNGFLSFRQVRKPRTDLISEQSHLLDPLWPPDEAQHDRTYRSEATLPSEISSIKMLRTGNLPTDDTMSKHLVITTMGSNTDQGSIWVLNLSKPLEFHLYPLGRLSCLARYKQTLWTVDSDSAGKNISIGTNRGVMLRNIETGVQSWVLRSKSDVLSLQYDTMGRVILAGQRNGSVISVDPRSKQISGRRISTAAMPSSVCCLSLLKLWDQYFIASSMDGSIRLYDHRLMKRGPVQSYEGNVNSHTRINLGVDPSETFVLSGGEDCHIRLWDIKSGELLFNKRSTNSVASAVCWPKIGGKWGASENGQEYWEKHDWGAWLGSYEGIYYMDWHL